MSSNSQVGHLWANQSKQSAKSGNGNFWFEGRILYSYSTPIANLVDGPRGFIALVTDKTYSPTTLSKHMPTVHRGIGYSELANMQAFSVPFIATPSGLNLPDSFNMAEVHAGNMAYFTDSYFDTIASLKRKRDLWQGVHESLQAAANVGRDYCEAFGLDYEDAFDVDGRTAEVEAHRAARETPAAIAKRERAAAVRKAAADAEAAREAAVRVAREAELRATFYPGGPYYGHALRDASGGALLRVQGDTLQTSLGAEVPLAHAVKVFRFVKLCRERGESWHRNGRTIRVGHFQVDRIAADGDFWAGCHRINWPEVERLAGTPGLLDAAPSAEAVEPSRAVEV